MKLKLLLLPEGVAILYPGPPLVYNVVTRVFNWEVEGLERNRDLFYFFKCDMWKEGQPIEYPGG